jgi:hypothetical protein
MCFANFTPQGDILLGGGAVSDTSALRQLPAEIRRAIKAAGGLYFNLLKFVQHRFADEYDAIFGYCADPRAMMVDLAAGFERTEHKNLIVYFPRRLSARRQRKLIEQAHKVGPF